MTLKGQGKELPTGPDGAATRTPAGAGAERSLRRAFTRDSPENRPGSSAVQVAIELLHRVGGVGGLAQCGVDELCGIPGIGPAKAAQLKAAVEFGKRAMAQPLSTGHACPVGEISLTTFIPLFAI